MKRLLFAAMIVSAAVFASPGQDRAVPETPRSLFWQSADPVVEIVIIDRRLGFNLIVISEENVVVTYRTSINSSVAVEKKLEPVRSERGRKYFLVEHSFSRRTIWMALDFEVGGKDVPGLTRTFYDGFLEIVPNDKFRVPKRK